MSPMTDGDSVIAHVGGPGNGAIVAFNRTTGTRRWVWKGDGPAYASPIVLHVRPGIRDHFMPWMKRSYPWLYPRYVELYGNRSYAPKAYVQQVGERFARLRVRHGLTSSGGSRDVPASREQQLALAV